MVAFYDNRPSKFENVGNVSIVYRYNIEEVEAPATQEGEPARTQWRCEEVTVWSEVTKKKVVAAVISGKWELNHEQKLANEYNSVALGVITGDEAAAVTAAYTAFLSDRKALKAAVEADCDEEGIL